MPDLQAEFEVVTPLFAGGAAPTEATEVRIASLKGALRFWWRALALAERGGGLEAVRRDEGRLFGSTSTGAGQARVAFRLSNHERYAELKPPAVLRDGAGSVVGPGARYLGFGLVEVFGSRRSGTEAGQLIRPCALPGLRFTVNFYCQDKTPDPALVNAVKLLGLLGGMGSRVRRGYGSLCLRRLRGKVDWEAPADRAAYARELGAVLGSAASWKNPAPEYSAFSSATRVRLLGGGRDAMTTLDWVGRQMQRYRAWGFRGEVNGEPSERRFEDDHDWSKDESLWGERHPRRIVFGLPHNYGKAPRVQPERHDRRGSPLFLHIHPLQDEFVAVATVFRSRFLPQDKRIKVIGQNRSRYVQSYPDFGIIDDFLDGRSRNDGRPYFPDAVDILSGSSGSP